MRSLKLILEIFFWSFAAAMVMFGAGVVLGLIFAPAVGYLAAIAVIGFLPIGLKLARVIRRRRGAMMLQYLEQAVRLNLPLPRMLRAAQQSERGPLALRLAQLRQLIEEGYPIGAALEGGAPEVGQREATLIASAERMGRLPQALRGIIREQASVNRSEGSADAAFYRAYPMVMIVALGSAISTLSIYVFPKYETIYRDFAIKLPWITTTTFRLSETLGP